MIIKIKKLLFCALIILFTIIFTPVSFAAVSLPWSTTYNCADWAQADLYAVAGQPWVASPLNCDGVVDYGGWLTSNGSKEQVTLAANNPGGGGGKGQRHWLGDGQTVNSGGTKIEFSSQSEFWMRWYMRFEQGFQWANLVAYKMLYINVGGQGAITPGWMSYNKLYMGMLGNCGGDVNCTSIDGTGWDAIMANGIPYIQAGTYIRATGVPTYFVPCTSSCATHKSSDGQWHSYEVHFKLNIPGQSNGVAEFWIDGIKKTSYANANFGTATGWTLVVIGSNAQYPYNGRDMYVDYDDIAISTTGYIGPISGGSASDTTPPSAPSGVAVN